MKVRISLLIACVCFLAIIGFLRAPWAWELSCEALRRELPHRLNLQVDIGECRIDPLTQTFVLKHFVLSRDGQELPLLQVDEASVSMKPMLFGKFGLKVRRMELQRPKIHFEAIPEQPETASVGFCDLDLLERLPVEEFSVKDGHIDVVLPNSRAVRLSGLNVQTRLHRGSNEVQISARGGQVQVDRDHVLAAGRLFLEGSVNGADQNIDIQRSEWVVDQAHVQVTGQIESLCQPRLALDARIFLPLAVVSRASGWEKDSGGHLWAKITAKGSARNPAFLLDVRGTSLKWGPFAPGDFSARLTLKEGVLGVDGFEASAGQGSVKIQGKIRLSSGLPFSASLKVKEAEFADILRKASVPHSWVDFWATGKGSFEGTLNPFHLQGAIDIASENFILAARSYAASSTSGRDILAFSQAQVQTEVEITKDFTHFQKVQVKTGRSLLSGDVKLQHGAPAGIDAEIKSQALDLGELKSIAGFQWNGRGKGQFSIHGPFSNVEAYAELNLRDAEFWDLSLGVLQTKVHYRDGVLKLPAIVGQKGKSPYTGQVELRFDDEVYSTLRLDMPQGRADDVIDVLAKFHSSFEVFQGLTTGQAATSVQIEGPSSRLGGTLDFQLKGLHLYDRHIGDGRVKLRLVQGETLVLEKTTLRGDLGTASLQGVWALGGPLDFRFRYEQSSIGKWVGDATSKELGLSGIFTLAGTVSGDSSMPAVSAYLTSPGVTFASRNLGPSQMEARVLGREVQVWGSPFADAHGTLKLTLRAPYAYQASLRLALPEIRPLLPTGAIGQGVSGSLLGKIQASGYVREPSKLNLDAEIERLTLSRGDFAGSNEQPVVVTFRDGKWNLHSFDFRGANTQFLASGEWGPSQVDLKAQGYMDVRLLESFVPEVERSGGRIHLSLSIGGTTKEPSLVGAADGKDIRFSLKGYPLTFSALNGRLEFSESRVLLQDVQGLMNEGTLRLRGDARLRRFVLERAELGMDFDSVLVRWVEGVPLKAHGSLLLQGGGQDMTLRGRVDVASLHYKQLLSLDGLLQDVKKAPRFVQVKPSGEWLRYDVDLALGDDVWVDNNLAQAKLKGTLKLTGNNVRPGLLGRIDAEEGSRAYYRGNAFVVSKGELQFKGTSGLDMFIDLNAQTQVREFLVTLKSFGRANDPKVILSSYPALPEADILTLLTLGLTSRDTAITDRAVSSFGLAAEALLTASGLDRRVQSFLPKNTVFKDLQMHMATTYNGATRQVEPAWMVESKLLSEQLKLSMVQPISGFSGLRGYRAQAEWRMTDRVSARAQWDNENQGYSLGNPGLDLKMRFEWE